MSKDKKVCVLCGGSFEGHGNNPAPLKDNGECCDECNKRKVIPARVEALKKKKGLEESLGKAATHRRTPFSIDREGFEFDDDYTWDRPEKEEECLQYDDEYRR